MIRLIQPFKRRYGIFFGNNSLDRLSFLRKDGDFIKKAIKFSDTRLIFINDYQPVCIKQNNQTSLLKLKVKDISQEFKKYLVAWSEANDDESNSILKFSLITFLGVDKMNNGKELNSDISGSKSKSIGLNYKVYSGVPYFGIDVTNNGFIQKEILKHQGELLNVDKMKTKYFTDHLELLNNEEASVFSQANMYLDWLQKNKYCSNCGSVCIPENAGSQIKCSGSSQRNCITNESAFTNISYPRTDIAIISTVISEDEKKILLVNNRRLPIENLYTCVAGFLEPSETFETCVSREIWEETNIIVKNENPGDIKCLVSQPWPYPATLMLGCCGKALKNGNVINTEHDNELKDAKWFELEYIKNLSKEYEKIDQLIKYSTGDVLLNLEKSKRNLAKEEILLPMENTVALSLIKGIFK